MPPQSFPSAAFSFLWSLYSAFDFRLVTNAEGSGLPYEVSPFGVGIFGLLGNGLQSDFFTDVGRSHTVCGDCRFVDLLDCAFYDISRFNISH